MLESLPSLGRDPTASCSYGPVSPLGHYVNEASGPRDSVTTSHDRMARAGIQPQTHTLLTLDHWCRGGEGAGQGPRSSLFFIHFFILFIYSWLSWVFVAARGLSLVVASGGYSSLWCMDFSLKWLLLLRSMGSGCVGFSTCSVWAQ